MEDQNGPFDSLPQVTLQATFSLAPISTTAIGSLSRPALLAPFIGFAV